MDTTKLKNKLGDKVLALHESADVAGAETILATTNSDYLALNSNALDIIRENLKNQPLSFDFFDVVKSPSGGSTVFSVPGLAGDEAAKELTGIILDYTTPPGLLGHARAG